MLRWLRRQDARRLAQADAEALICGQGGRGRTAEACLARAVTLVPSAAVA